LVVVLCPDWPPTWLLFVSFCCGYQLGLAKVKTVLLCLLRVCISWCLSPPASGFSQRWAHN
jgi:hypothetical protein